MRNVSPTKFIDMTRDVGSITEVGGGAHGLSGTLAGYLEVRFKYFVYG